MLSTAFTWLYAIVGVPLGRLADRWSRRNLLAAGLTRVGRADGDERDGARLHDAADDAAWRGRRRSHVRPHRHQLDPRPVSSSQTLGVPIGAAMSCFFSGPLAQASGWRAAMMVAAFALLIAPVAFFGVLQRPGSLLPALLSAS